MTRPNLVKLYEDYCESFPFGLTQDAKPWQWTEGVKGFWIDQGEGRQYKVKVRGNIRGKPDQPRHPDHEPKEFMIDVVWEDMADGHRCLQLVMECEWDRKREDKEFDFRKILHSRAYSKVFVFDVGKRTDLAQPGGLVHHFYQLIRGCKIAQQPPEEYLLICHRDGPGTYTTINGFLVPSGGNLQELPEQRRDVPRQ